MWASDDIPRSSNRRTCGTKSTAPQPRQAIGRNYFGESLSSHLAQRIRFLHPSGVTRRVVRNLAPSDTQSRTDVHLIWYPLALSRLLLRIFIRGPQRPRSLSSICRVYNPQALGTSCRPPRPRHYRDVLGPDHYVPRLSAGRVCWARSTTRTGRLDSQRRCYDDRLTRPPRAYSRPLTVTAL